MTGEVLILKVKPTSFYPGDTALPSSGLEQVAQTLGFNL